MSMVSVNFHYRDRAIGDEMPSASHLRKEREHIVVSLGEGPDSAVVNLFFASAASAYAFASTVMSGAEYLESVEEAAKGDPERPWIDVPLPLDQEELVGQGADVVQLCACGKPAAHVHAPADSAEWSCRVPPVVAPVLDAWPEDVRPAPAICVQGTALKCAEVGCTDESCARF